jgi:hypothetical protein
MPPKSTDGRPTLRGSETRTLTTVGAFRAVPASDLRDSFDQPLDPRHGELWHLRDSGLVQLPIAIHPAGRGVVVYVVTDPWLDEFRAFLERHAALLRALPAWTLRIVVPPQFPNIAQRAKQVVWNQLLTPLRSETLDELRWYFEQARTHPAPSRCDDLDERFYKAREAFSAPRFKALYRVWKQDGEAALAAAGSHPINDAVKSDSGQVETLELGHRYGHLAPGYDGLSHCHSAAKEMLWLTRTAQRLH